ncbi:MAG: thiamine-phosphate kinase [Betaproteobacteria bacterium]|nr:MAG: thiamine-phosphate kinase [Betaproteobacteria bacterium]
MTTEFELIDRYFSRPTSDATLGVGDDAALVEPSPGHELVVTADTIVSGVHFLPDTEPRSLGNKALAVNLSDLAAMGARPRWALLAVTVPKADDAWLSAFAEGFYDLARRHNVALIGGDTTRGPLAITVTALGEVASGTALRRDGARVGDELWISGQVGSAALALRHIRGEVRLKGKGLEACMARLERPIPRVELGQALVDVASSAIDVSDGLVADAGHICTCSGVGIEISYADVPSISEVTHLKGDQVIREALLAGGDDYELLFTVPAGESLQMDSISARLGLALTRVGRVVAGKEVHVLDESGEVIAVDIGGYEHFA